MLKLKRLNLGCGQFPKKGFINIDININAKADIICDLSKIPYPFKNNSFELIVAEHVMEHLENPFDVMKEIWRILIPGGKIIIKVPHFTRGFTHPEHKRGFDVSFYYYFRSDFKGGYVNTEYKLTHISLKWFAQEYLKKEVLSPPFFMMAKSIGIVIDFFANISPFFCSRCWAFLVGGFEEIEFHFVKPEVL